MITSTLRNLLITSTALITCVAVLFISYPPVAVASTLDRQSTSAQLRQIKELEARIAKLREQLSYMQTLTSTDILKSGSLAKKRTNTAATEVPFYSQFTDITKPGWQKIGCGIASVAMLIDYYSDENINVDALLDRGIANNAYLTDAGWIHSGLIGLARSYGLDGQSMSLAHLSKDAALAELERVLAAGPVMASVHYTFEPTNPIPHLVVINHIKDGTVYYNDPAEQAGNGTLTTEQFQRGWKQRYIVIRPV